MIALYPGSFDPVTLGHKDIIQRASNIFDKVIVAVAVNYKKQTLFTNEERVKLLQESVREFKNVEISQFEGLSVEYARKCKARVLIRGLRAISDFEAELSMASINKELDNELDTVFLMTAKQYAFLSSSAVKEIARMEGSLDSMVDPHVAKALKERFAKG